MNNRALLVLGVVFGGFVVLFLIFLGIAYMAVEGDSPRRASSGRGPRIGVVEINGYIGNAQTGVEGAREAEQIREFARDASLEAIVVRLETPGGAVAPAQEIYEAVKNAREKKKVVCSMGQVAASGGYYIAAACDEIVANPGTLTASIGVITQFFGAGELLRSAKLEQHTFKSGSLKDAGSPFRAFTETDRRFFSELVADVYDQFIDAVAEGREKTREELAPVADGRVMTGAQAHAIGLVDHLGGFRTAIDRAVELAGASGEAVLVYPEKKGELKFLELLRNEARATAREAVRGATEGVTGTAFADGVYGGPLFLAPGFH